MKVSPHSSLWWDRESLLVQTVYLVFIMENVCIQLTEGELEIKYPLQKGYSGKGSPLTQSSWSAYLDISLTWRTLCYMISDYNPHVECCDHFLQDRNWVGSRQNAFRPQIWEYCVSKSIQAYWFLSGDKVPIVPLFSCMAWSPLSMQIIHDHGQLPIPYHKTWTFISPYSFLLESYPFLQIFL